MLGTQDHGPAAKEHRADEAKTDYAVRSQPLCFAFIDSSLENMGDNIVNAAEWYREQVAKLDKAGEAAVGHKSSAKDAEHEFYADEVSNVVEADELLASSGR